MREPEVILTARQVAYLMADISDVNVTVIKDIYQRLESLSCKGVSTPLVLDCRSANEHLARIMTRVLY